MALCALVGPRVPSYAMRHCRGVGGGGGGGNLAWTDSTLTERKSLVNCHRALCSGIDLIDGKLRALTSRCYVHTCTAWAALGKLACGKLYYRHLVISIQKYTFTHLSPTGGGGGGGGFEGVRTNPPPFDRLVSIKHSLLTRPCGLHGLSCSSLVPRPYEGEKRAWYTLLAHAPGAPEKCGAPDTIVYLVYDAYPVYALS